MSKQPDENKILTPREQRAKERNAVEIKVGERYYVSENNPNELRYITGVPLRDLSEQEFAALPEHLQRSVDDSDLYRKTKPPVASASAPKPKQEG